MRKIKSFLIKHMIQNKVLNRRKTTSFNFTLEAAWKKAVVLPYWVLHSRNLAVRSDQSCTWEMSSHFDTTDHKVLQVLTLPYHPAFKDFPRIWGTWDDRFCGLILIWLLTFGVSRCNFTAWPEPYLPPNSRDVGRSKNLGRGGGVF